MPIKLTFKLTRPARKLGGDRYEATLRGKEGPVIFYIPQEISRDSGKVKLSEPVETMEIYFEPK